MCSSRIIGSVTRLDKSGSRIASSYECRPRGSGVVCLNSICILSKLSLKSRGVSAKCESRDSVVEVGYCVVNSHLVSSRESCLCLLVCAVEYGVGVSGVGVFLSKLSLSVSDSLVKSCKIKVGINATLVFVSFKLNDSELAAAFTLQHKRKENVVNLKGHIEVATNNCQLTVIGVISLNVSNSVSHLEPRTCVEGVSLGIYGCTEDSKLLNEQFATLCLLIECVEGECIDGSSLFEADAYPYIKSVLVALVISYDSERVGRVCTVVSVGCDIRVKRTVNDSGTTTGSVPRTQHIRSLTLITCSTILTGSLVYGEVVDVMQVKGIVIVECGAFACHLAITGVSEYVYSLLGSCFLSCNGNNCEY